MPRVLRRPMFRTGGTAEGITSGLAPRQGYKDANLVEQLTTQKSIIDALAPRQPRQDRSMSNFLIDFGLDIASRSPSGSIFSTAAAAAKDPFAKFQQAKQMQDAYGMSETSEDRALIASLIKGMDEDKLAAMMKEVKLGVEAGQFANEAEGIKLLLQKKIYGVLPMEGEEREGWIKLYMKNLMRENVDPGVLKSVAEHQYKIDFKEYPKEVLADVNRSKLYIKFDHITGRKSDEDGDVFELVVDSIHKSRYRPGQIYFDPQTGNLFQRTSKEGDAIIFTRIDFEQ